ncbi:F-box/FBD/LRR-repeat protein At1g13570-like [Solanum dulcamara]|uniref:F-box/FBD/LRR-repeat protein At1g13570-like n=1 Tax=Solanum dulcamara TaxID=45834 RepID=UPI0024867A9E|nr:F-box/FBD/LRR-repeat protein At1g13570-like [Solanum dulcamara]
MDIKLCYMISLLVHNQSGFLVKIIRKHYDYEKKNPFWFALAFPAFAAPSIAFCADPAPALPDLNEIPVGLSPAEIAQLHRENGGRKYCRCLLPDVFNYLPDNVTDVILMHLPCKDAVRTSILSKKWRYHWCRLTELRLDESLWKTKKDLLNPTVKFTKTIYQLLTLHEGPITKFTLDVVHLESCPGINNFICFLSRNDIQHLVLHLPHSNIYKLPSALFTCSQLRHLNLHNCSIHHPPAFQGFDKLISLELCEVTISSELLESLISHCPLLEQLVLDIADNSDTIEINAPMLSLFNFSGNISSICLKNNVPCLVKASLDCDYIKAEDLDFAKVFESCSSLEHLVFKFYNSRFFAEEGFEGPTRLPFDLNSVKRFYLPDIMLIESSYELSYALCLIRSFPYLEYLEIKVYCEDEEDDCVLECFKLEQFSDKLLDTRLKILAKVSSFSRASPKAEVVYIDF